MNEWDIVAARQLGRNLAKELGFQTVDQAIITTAISELARNIFLYAGQGEIIISKCNENNKVGLKITAIDESTRICDEYKVKEGGYNISGGLVVGLPGVMQLMDVFTVEKDINEGTKIIAIKWLQ